MERDPRAVATWSCTRCRGRSAGWSGPPRRSATCPTSEQQPDLVPPVAPLGDAPDEGAAIAVGQGSGGALLDGTLTTQADGAGRFVPSEGSPAFPRR